MRTISLLLALTVLAASSVLADFEAVTIRNAGLARVVSGVSNILKTTDIKFGDYGLLEQPTMEFMIELDYKGERVHLVPTDFTIEAIDRFSKNKVDTMGVELLCRREGLPLTVFVDYIRAPGVLYQQKLITISPCKKAKDAVIRRVTVESLRFKKAVQPLSVGATGFASDPKSAFAFVEPKSGRGMCFDFASGKYSVTGNRTLVAFEEVEVPAEKGWRSGKYGISAVSGTPETAFRAYWQFLIDTRHPELTKNAKLTALEKRFPTCFAACQYLPLCSADGQVTAVGRIAGNKGFIFFSNAGAEAAKVTIPLSSDNLGLSGDLELSDWTSLDKPNELGTKTASGNVEVEVAARGYFIVGINVE